MLTLPESDAVRATVIVWVPAAKARPAEAMAQVFQSAVAGMVMVCPVPPSTDTVSVRTVSCPSAPREFAYCASNWYVPAAATLTRNDSELPMAWNPAAKPRPVEPEWSSAAGTPLRLRSSAWHSAPMVHAGMDAERPVLCAGVAVPAFRPASWSPPEPWLVQAIAPAISAAQLSAVSATRMPFR